MSGRNSIFYIDNYILDDLMRTMSGASFKVLVFLLRNYPSTISFQEIIRIGGLPKPISNTEIARRCGISDGTARKVVSNLRKRGLISRAKRSGYVYIIRSGDFYKIGCSKDPKSRIKQIDTGPIPCELVYLIPTDDMFELEGRIQNIYENKQVHKEWFSLELSDLERIRFDFPGNEG